MSGNFVPPSAASKLGTAAKPWSELHVGTVHATGLHAGTLSTDTDLWGLEVDFANGVSATNATRLESAEGLLPADFDGLAPWQRRKCLVDDSGAIVAYHGDPGYSEPATGKLADGTNVQVMVWQPAFWYRTAAVTTDSLGIARRVRYYVSAAPRTGYRLHPAFVSDGVEQAGFLSGAYLACLQDMATGAIKQAPDVSDCKEGDVAVAATDALASVRGAQPQAWMPRPRMRLAAANRGSGWQLKSYQMHCAEALLMLVEYGTLDLQSTALGAGDSSPATTDSAGTAINSMRPSGLSSALGNGSGGDNTYTCWRGEENLWGAANTALDGVSLLTKAATGAATVYIADHGYAECTAASPYADSGLAIVPPLLNGWDQGYVSAFARSDACDWAFLPSEAKGSSAGPVGDMYTWVAKPATDTWTTVQAGGISGAGAGMFQHYCTLEQGAGMRGGAARLARLVPKGGE